MLSDLLTNSRKKTARRCMREHQLRYDLGYRAVSQAEELRFGTLVHAGLEAWWLHTGSDADTRLAAALAALEGEADPYEKAKARVMLAGYEARWGAEASDYEVIGVEVEFRCVIRNPATGAPSRTWRGAGKLDAIARHRPTGRVRLVEHKTSSEDISPGSDYWLRLRMDGQVSDYFAGAEALGHPADDCLYDVLGKPRLRPAKATPLEARKYKKDGTLYANQRDTDETPEEYQERLVEEVSANPDKYYQRGTVARLESDLEEARFDTWQIGRAIRDAQLAGRAPRNPDACVRYGRKCAFFDVCSGAASIDDPMRFVRSDNVHPELSEETTEAEEEETAA